MKYILIYISIIGFVSCVNKSKYDDLDKSYEKNLYDLIFNTPKIRNSLTQLFIINDETPKIFKILISRNGSSTRFTITQIFYEFELEELPFSYVKYKNKFFFYYNGSEMILNKHIDREQVSEILQESNIKLKKYSIYDSRVFQFDLGKNKEISINTPPIENNYNREEVRFKPALRSIP